MEQQGVLLRGIARVLNAGGSALLNVYDAVVSIKDIVLPGEKGNLSAQLRDYEKKIDRLYCEIGKEVALREESAGLSAAAEAGIKLVAEHQAEIEKMRQRLQKIEIEEKAAAAAKAAAAKKEAAPERAAAKAKTAAEAATEETKDITAKVAETLPAEMTADVAEAAEPEVAEESTGNAPEKSADILAEVAETQAPETDAGAAQSAEPETGEVPAVAATEAIKDISAEGETPGEKLQEETDQSEAQIAGESPVVAEMKQEADPEMLEEMLKSDLLKICADKGIDADQRMTKAAIIGLIKKGRK